jgi:DNA processing protein
MIRYQLDHRDYPEALRELPNPPAVLTASGPLEPRRAIAIVGSRQAGDEARAFAHDLAYQLASAGIVVVSGGAVGVDAAAHRGALEAGGTTWVVSPTGKDRVYPAEHRALFEEIARSEDSRMIWSFPDDAKGTTQNLLFRNGVLAALSEALVVIQAHHQSGSRNACNWARDLGRPVWAMTAAPWMLSFCGSSLDIELGLARPLCSPRQLMKALGLGYGTQPPQLALPLPTNGRARANVRIPETPPEPLVAEPWTEDEKSVFSALSTAPRHVDQIVDRTGLQVPPVVTALLTLSLKDVVVEGPDGFFRRRSAA